jgi:pimeloyl-ACP methyl ester carboxylesterase
MLMDASKQQARMKEYCALSGQVSSATRKGQLVVVLIRQQGEAHESTLMQMNIADHHILPHGGRWRFSIPAGTYRVAAFDDANSNLVYEPGEPFEGADAERTFHCSEGEQWQDVTLSVPVAPARQFDLSLDVATLQLQNAGAGVEQTLGQLTAAGELASLTDARFRLANAENSLWRPYDFIVQSRPGVYFLERYDPARIPVLFVHGINGSPLNFEHLIRHLDRSRFQPWVYSYPSGAHLASIADHLTQVMLQLEARHHVDRFAVIAHSMGGLVARGFVLRHAKSSQAQVALLATMSTPWAGHEAAEIGVNHAPVVVNVWRDMVPGSDYITSLFSEALPKQTSHHLIFTFSRKSASFGASGDRTVTVASQLSQPAQRQAIRIHGIDSTHDGVLQSDEATGLLNELLESSYPVSPQKPTAAASE